MAKYSIKQILTSNQNWWRFYEIHQHRIRLAILICIVKLLTCKNTIRGYHEYRCSNPICHHVKKVPHTCKCKACSSCGKKATEIWIQKQNQLLPNTSWQHITFTMPSELWDFFWYNRFLLNQIGALAAHCVKTIANRKNVTLGIFIAIHTFGRDLKRNVHIHLSTTTGGLSEDYSQWKNIFFHQPTLMRMWRYKIIQLFRQHQSSLVIPPSIKKQLHHAFTFDQFIARFIQHIPDVGFRMIRYYGFLAHRIRGKLLPIVHKLLEQDNTQPQPPLTYAQLIQINFNFNPLVCILCGQPLVLTTVRFGLSKISDLINLHRPLALLQKI
jgi:hypothetical protein